MKKEFIECPDFFIGKEMYGFDWREFVVSVPSPLVVVTSYKDNGKTNATLQSWLTFSNEDGFYCIFSSVNKNGHMYKTIKNTKSLVINFPTVDNYMKCHATIKNNKYEDDEISMAGLTAEKSTMVNAPRIKECFLNLECEYLWEKELLPGACHVVMCVKVVNVVMDDEYYDEGKKGRYGDTGYLYNIHSPVNPENGNEENTYVGTLKKFATYEELEKM